MLAGILSFDLDRDYYYNKSIGAKTITHSRCIWSEKALQKEGGKLILSFTKLGLIAKSERAKVPN